MTEMTPNPSDHIDSIAGQIKDHCMHLECLRDIPDDMQRDLARGVAILKEAGCQQVYVFGSIAEGHVRPDSDIDFAVRGCPAKLFFKLQGRLLVELRRSADLIDLDADPDLAAFLEREAAMIHVD